METKEMRREIPILDCVTQARIALKSSDISEIEGAISAVKANVRLISGSLATSLRGLKRTLENHRQHIETGWKLRTPKISIEQAFAYLREADVVLQKKAHSAVVTAQNMRGYVDSACRLVDQIPPEAQSFLSDSLLRFRKKEEQLREAINDLEEKANQSRKRTARCS